MSEQALMSEAEIRADERAKWSRRLRENKELFARFAADKEAAVALAALMMEIGVGGD